MKNETNDTIHHDAEEVTSSESDGLSLGRHGEKKDTVEMMPVDLNEDEDGGYAADVEEDAWKEQEDEPVVYPSTFPRPPKRRRLVKDEQQHQASLALVSSVLSQYKPTAVEKENTSLPKRPPFVFNNNKRGMVRLPQVSCRHVCLEQAIACSPLARIVLQAQPPHAVVHANAAYAQMRRNLPFTQGSFHHQHHQSSLMNASQNAFEGMSNHVQLTMYPVCELRREVSTITHYMIEAQVCHSSEEACTGTMTSIIPTSCSENSMAHVQIVG